MASSQHRKASARAVHPSGLAISLVQCKYEVVREAAERLGYTVVGEEDALWDLCWSDLSVTSERVQKMRSFQRLNHFPGMLEICRKASLSRHMSRMAARWPADYAYYPPSMHLPDQLDELLAALKRSKARACSYSGRGAGPPTPTFILKPSAGTQGRGISLVQTPEQLAEAGDVSNHVAQAYVANPLLLDGFKFDLRVYALVSSVDPLRVHLFEEGLARLATQPYQPPAQPNLRTATMHLTNYAVNKASAAFVQPEAAEGDGSGGGSGAGLGGGGGSKRAMSAVLAQVAAQHGTTTETLYGAIAGVVVKTLLAIQPLLGHSYHTALGAGGGQGGACSWPCLEHRPPGHHAVHAERSGSDGGCGAGQQPQAYTAGGDDDPTARCCCPPSLCFEVLGFDVLLDEALQPWLLEVNHSPSFTTDSPLDRAVKEALIRQAMQALAQRPGARSEYLEEQQRQQQARLYTGSDAGGGGPAGHSGAAARRRASSAMPRSRRLQAAAAALDDIILRGGSGARAGGSRGSTPSGWDTASDDTASDHGGGWPPGRRAHSHSSTGFGGEGATGAGGGGEAVGTVGPNGLACRFKLVYPTASEPERSCYSRLLQAAADLFPDQRCHCAWCSRRREARLLAMSARDLGLHSRPPSAVSLGHLPSRSPARPTRPLSSLSMYSSLSEHAPAAGAPQSHQPFHQPSGMRRQLTHWGPHACANGGAGSGDEEGPATPPRPSARLGLGTAACVGTGGRGLSPSALGGDRTCTPPSAPKPPRPRAPSCSRPVSGTPSSSSPDTEAVNSSQLHHHHHARPPSQPAPHPATPSSSSPPLQQQQQQQRRPLSAQGGAAFRSTSISGGSSMFAAAGGSSILAKTLSSPSTLSRGSAREEERDAAAAAAGGRGGRGASSPYQHRSSAVGSSGRDEAPPAASGGGAAAAAGMAKLREAVDAVVLRRSHSCTDLGGELRRAAAAARSANVDAEEEDGEGASDEPCPCPCPCPRGHHGHHGQSGMRRGGMGAYSAGQQSQEASRYGFTRGSSSYNASFGRVGDSPYAGVSAKPRGSSSHPGAGAGAGAAPGEGAPAHAQQQQPGVNAGASAGAAPGRHATAEAQRSSSASRVPRVALLAGSGRRRGGVAAEPPLSAVDFELMSMRMRAATLLSNRFVSVYVAGLGGSPPSGRRMR